MGGLRARGYSHTIITMLSGPPVSKAVNYGTPTFLQVLLDPWLIIEFSLENTPFSGKALLAVCVNAVRPSCHDTVGRHGLSPINLCHHWLMIQSNVGNNPARKGLAIIVLEVSLSESYLPFFLPVLFICGRQPLKF